MIAPLLSEDLELESDGDAEPEDEGAGDCVTYTIDVTVAEEFSSTVVSSDVTGEAGSEVDVVRVVCDLVGVAVVFIVASVEDEVLSVRVVSIAFVDKDDDVSAEEEDDDDVVVASVVDSLDDVEVAVPVEVPSVPAAEAEAAAAAKSTPSCARISNELAPPHCSEGKPTHDCVQPLESGPPSGKVEPQ